MRILAFGTYDAAKHPRIAVVLAGLRERGVEVVELNAPLGFDTAERVDMLRKPWLGYRLVLRLAARWCSLARQALRLRREQPVDAVLVGYLGHFDVLLARMLFPSTRIVLDQLIFAADTAVDRGVRSGWKLRILRLIDRVAIRSSDVVMLDTDEQRQLMPRTQGQKAVVVPVGSPQRWFTAGAEAASSSAHRNDTTLRVVFFGLYTPLQGATVIGAALGMLADRPDITVTMVGTGQDRERTQRLAAGNPYVRWRDWVAADELPALVARHDVCLGIFGETPKAWRVVPNKVYQGAAAGCALVTSDTPPQRRMLNDAAVYVRPGDPAALATALRELASDRGRLDTLRVAAREIAGERFTPAAVGGFARAAFDRPAPVTDEGAHA